MINTTGPAGPAGPAVPGTKTPEAPEAPELPTKIDLDKIVSENENFFCKEHNFGGTGGSGGSQVFVYSYRLNDYSTFKTEAHRELRGITVVVENGQEKVYPALKKFWNINENKDYQYKDINQLQIKHVYDKIDGSMIQPILIQGGIVTKTKLGFDNSQAEIAQNIVDTNAELQFFILDMFRQGWHPIFELIGPDNKIVLDYDTNELKLIAVRTSDGNFISPQTVGCPVTVVEEYNLSLDECIEMCKLEEGFEGFVVRFKNNGRTDTVKIKSLWYIENHRLLNDADRNSEILKMVLGDKLDDVLSVVDTKTREKLLEKQNVIVSHYNHLVVDIQYIIHQSKDCTRREIAQQNKDHDYFGVIMKCLQYPDKVEEELKSMILKKYSKEEQAKKFIIICRVKTEYL